jgi:hypothetical protein
MVDAKQLITRVLSWFRPGGRTSSSGVLEALYCSAPEVPVVGRLQARRERKRGFQVPGEVAEDVVGELESKRVESSVSLSCVVSRLVSCLLFPLRQGGSSSFYRPRRERITCMPLFSYVGKCGVLCCRVGGCLDGPCRDPVIMAYLVPEQG